MKNVIIFFIGIAFAFVVLKWDFIKEKLAESSNTYQNSSVTYQNSSVTFQNSSESNTNYMNNNNLSAEEDLTLASAWQNGEKSRCVNQLNNMKTVFDSKTSCPAYHYVNSLANETRSAIIRFEQAIGHDDYRNVAQCERNAIDAMRRFEMNCRWRAGVSRGDGTHSGKIEGTWEPDVGRAIIGGRSLKVIRCSKCSGKGQVQVVENCPSCNGRGRVANPAAQVTDVVNITGSVFSMLDKKGRGGNIRTPNLPREINCTSCNGQGRIKVTRQCSNCSGKGEIYEP